MSSLTVHPVPNSARICERGYGGARETADRVAIAYTLARLALAPIMMGAFMVLPTVTIAALAAFIAADVHDGVLARRRASDGPARRAIDSAVDRIAIDACLVAAYAHGALPLPLVGAFLLRDLYCALACGVMFRRRGVAIKADWLYRGLNLSVAGWAVAAPFVSQDARSFLFIAVLAGSAVVALDLTRSVGRVLAMPNCVDGTVIHAGDLRARRAHEAPTHVAPALVDVSPTLWHRAA